MTGVFYHEDSDHVQNDTIYQVHTIGWHLKMHGVMLYQVQVSELNLPQIYFYLLPVTAVTISLFSIRVRWVSTTHLLLVLQIPVTPITSTSIRPVSVQMTATTVLTGARCVVPRVPQLLQPLPCMQMDEVKQW